MTFPENEDDAYDAMVERVDAGVECPHCRCGRDAITPAAKDLTGLPLYVCGCGAQWRGFFDVTRPRRAA
jgi:hypothetical protein